MALPTSPVAPDKITLRSEGMLKKIPSVLVKHRYSGRSAHSENLSVLLPTRNAATTLGPALRSTLNALRKSDEIILVIEESDYKSLCLLKNFVGEERLRIIRTREGASLSEKLNLGLAAVENDLVARMDADDLTLPWRFEFQRKRVVERSLDLSCGTAGIFGWDLRPAPFLPQLPISLSNAELRIALLKANPIMHPTVMFRASKIRQLGGYLDMPGEDLRLWLSAALAGYRMERAAIPLILYRYTRKSMSRVSETKKSIETDREIVRDRKQLFEVITAERSNITVMNRLRIGLTTGLNLGLNS